MLCSDSSESPPFITAVWDQDVFSSSGGIYHSLSLVFLPDLQIKAWLIAVGLYICCSLILFLKSYSSLSVLNFHIIAVYNNQRTLWTNGLRKTEILLSLIPLFYPLMIVNMKSYRLTYLPGCRISEVFKMSSQYSKIHYATIFYLQHIFGVRLFVCFRNSAPSVLGTMIH